MSGRGGREGERGGWWEWGEGEDRVGLEVEGMVGGGIVGWLGYDEIGGVVDGGRGKEWGRGDMGG